MKDTIFLMEKGIQVGMCDVPDMWILSDALKHKKKKERKTFQRTVIQFFSLNGTLHT